MGRSVAVPAHATETVYLDMRDDLNDEWDWDDFIDDLRAVVRERYPTFEDAKTWVGRECLAILENQHAYIVVSEYCGCVSVSLLPRAGELEMDGWAYNLSSAWCRQIESRWREYLESRYSQSAMQRMCTMANGVSVYQKVNTTGG